MKLNEFLNEQREIHGLVKSEQIEIINESDAVKLSKKRTDLEEVKDFLSSGTWAKMLGDFVFGKFDEKKVREIIKQRLSQPQKRAGVNPSESFIKIFSRELGLDVKKYIGSEIIEDVKFTDDLVDVLKYWSKEASKVNEGIGHPKMIGVGDVVKYKDKKGKEQKSKVSLVVTREDDGKYELENGETLSGSKLVKESEKIDEKLSASDKADLKKTTGLSEDEKNDFMVVYDLMDKLEGFQKVIEKSSKKIKTDEGQNQVDEIAWENNRESIWQMSDYINEMIEKINMGLQESFEFLEGTELNERELSPLQKEYQDYFKEKLEEFEVDSPAKLSAEKKIEFFKAIKSGWEVGKGRK